MNNGAWVSVDRLGGVYLVCLHPQCLKRGYSNKRRIGQAPLSLLSLCRSADAGGVGANVSSGSGGNLGPENVGSGAEDVGMRMLEAGRKMSEAKVTQAVMTSRAAAAAIRVGTLMQTCDRVRDQTSEL